MKIALGVFIGNLAFGTVAYGVIWWRVASFEAAMVAEDIKANQ